MTENTTLSQRSARGHHSALEARVAVLENLAETTEKSLTQIQLDLRFLLGLGLAATATILAVVAHGFHWI